jgi:predicted DNA-binding transcriptional regulator AlpA
MTFLYARASGPSVADLSVPELAYRNSRLPTGQGEIQIQFPLSLGFAKCEQRAPWLLGRPSAQWRLSVTHPPAYLSRATLAQELDMAESTVDEMVRRGVLPKPVKLSSGCVRWSWTAVECALTSLAGTNDDGGDPFMTGAKNAAKAS